MSKPAFSRKRDGKKVDPYPIKGKGKGKTSRTKRSKKGRPKKAKVSGVSSNKLDYVFVDSYYIRFYSEDMRDEDPRMEKKRDEFLGKFGKVAHYDTGTIDLGTHGVTYRVEPKKPKPLGRLNLQRIGNRIRKYAKKDPAFFDFYMGANAPGVTATIGSTTGGKDGEVWAKDTYIRAAKLVKGKHVDRAEKLGFSPRKYRAHVKNKEFIRRGKESIPIYEKRKKLSKKQLRTALADKKLKDYGYTKREMIARLMDFDQGLMWRKNIKAFKRSKKKKKKK